MRGTRSGWGVYKSFESRPHSCGLLGCHVSTQANHRRCKAPLYVEAKLIDFTPCLLVCTQPLPTVYGVGSSTSRSANVLTGEGTFGVNQHQQSDILSDMRMDDRSKHCLLGLAWSELTARTRGSENNCVPPKPYANALSVQQKMLWNRLTD
jgi:hypothetical protein